MLWTWFRTTSKTKLRYRRFGYNQFSQTVKRGAKLYGTVRYIHVYCSVTRNSLYLFTAKWEEDSRECNGKKTKNTRGRFFDIKILARARMVRNKAYILPYYTLYYYYYNMNCRYRKKHGRICLKNLWKKKEVSANELVYYRFGKNIMCFSRTRKGKIICILRVTSL